MPWMEMAGLFTDRWAAAILSLGIASQLAMRWPLDDSGFK